VKRSYCGREELFQTMKILQNLYENWSENVTLRVLKEIDFQIERIKKSPNLFPVVNKSLNIRRCIASRQTSVFFVIEENTITTLSIFDNRQDPDNCPQ